MSKRREFIKRLMVLESMWSLAKLITDDDAGDTDQEIGHGLVWKLLLWIIPGAGGASSLAWLAGLRTGYPLLWESLLFIIGFGVGFVVSRLYSIRRIKQLRKKKKDDAAPPRLREEWEVPGASEQVFTLYEVARLMHEDVDDPLKSRLVEDDFKYLALAARAGRLEVMPEEDTQGQEFDIGWIRAAETADELRDVRVHRKAVRELLKSVDRPVPEFLDERFYWESLTPED